MNFMKTFHVEDKIRNLSDKYTINEKKPIFT